MDREMKLTSVRIYETRLNELTPLKRQDFFSLPSLLSNGRIYGLRGYVLEEIRDPKQTDKEEKKTRRYCEKVGNRIEKDRANPLSVGYPKKSVGGELEFGERERLDKTAVDEHVVRLGESRRQGGSKSILSRSRPRRSYLVSLRDSRIGADSYPHTLPGDISIYNCVRVQKLLEIDDDDYGKSGLACTK